MERGGILPQDSVFGAVLQIRCKIADSREAKTGDRGVLCAVDRIIDTSRSAIHFNGTVALVEFPKLTAQYRSGSVDSGPMSQFCRLVVWVGRAVEQGKDDLLLGFAILNMTFADDPFAWCYWCWKCQAIRWGNIEFPPEIRDTEPLFYKKAIAQVPIFRSQAALNCAAHQG